MNRAEDHYLFKSFTYSSHLLKRTNHYLFKLLNEDHLLSKPYLSPLWTVYSYMWIVFPYSFVDRILLYAYIPRYRILQILCESYPLYANCNFVRQL